MNNLLKFLIFAIGTILMPAEETCGQMISVLNNDESTSTLKERNFRGLFCYSYVKNYIII